MRCASCCNEPRRTAHCLKWVEPSNLPLFHDLSHLFLNVIYVFWLGNSNKKIEKKIYFLFVQKIATLEWHSYAVEHCTDKCIKSIFNHGSYCYKNFFITVMKAGQEPKAILELQQDNNPRQFLSWQKLRTACVLTMKDSLLTICLTIIGTHVSPLINHTWTTYKDGPYYG